MLINYVLFDIPFVQGSTSEQVVSTLENLYIVME